MIEPEEFRSALSRFPSGVTVVTAMGSEDTYGITVSSFMSVSLAPPLIAVSIGHGALVHDLLLPGRHFGVSVLRSGQERVSDLFAGRQVEIDDPLRLLDGFPFVDGALSRLLCRVHDSHVAGDHTIFVGEVERLGYEEGQPLVYHRGRYARAGEFDLID